MALNPCASTPALLRPDVLLPSPGAVPRLEQGEFELRRQICASD